MLEYYPNLTEEEIKKIVIKNKWLASLKVMIDDANDVVLQNFIKRLKNLGERYETTLPQLQLQTKELANKVEKHLKSMGFKWQ